MTARCVHCGRANPLARATDPKALAVTSFEQRRLRKLHAAATQAGRAASARDAWLALYGYVAELTAHGRGGRQIADALGVSAQRVSQMLAKASR